ncbi:prephenate dehydrogenase [compost metagenome]
MKIGIVGVGNIGKTLARLLKEAGHTIYVANSRGVDGVRKIADEINVEAVDIYGAVNSSDVVILSIPFPAIKELPTDLFYSAATDKVIIDTSNYYPDFRDPHIKEIDDGMTESVWVSKQINRPVIKAFNNILAYSLAELGQVEGSKNRLAIAVAGDSVPSKNVVMSLVNDIGFDPVDAGSLEDSWRQQPCTPAYCCDYDQQMMRKGLAIAQKGEAQKKRDRLPELFSSLGVNPTHQDIVQMNRDLNPILD